MASEDDDVALHFMLRAMGRLEGRGLTEEETGLVLWAATALNPHKKQHGLGDLLRRLSDEEVLDPDTPKEIWDVITDALTDYQLGKGE